MAAQDVDDLRHLVEMSLPQEPSEGSDTRVIFGRPLRCEDRVGYGPHRAELEDLETSAVLPDSFLSVEQRPSIGHDIADCHQRDSHHEYEETSESDRNVGKTLHSRIPRAMHLANVEEQGSPLQFRHRQLAQP